MEKQNRRTKEKRLVRSDEKSILARGLDGGSTMLTSGAIGNQSTASRRIEIVLLDLFQYDTRCSADCLGFLFSCLLQMP